MYSHSTKSHPSQNDRAESYIDRGLQRWFDIYAHLYIASNNFSWNDSLPSQNHTQLDLHVFTVLRFAISSSYVFLLSPPPLSHTILVQDYPTDFFLLSMECLDHAIDLHIMYKYLY